MLSEKKLGKNLLNSSLVPIIFILLQISFLFNSCKKDNSALIVPNAELVKKAQQYYDREYAQLELKRITMQSNVISGGQSYPKNKIKTNPLWDGARIERTSNGVRVVTVPIVKYNMGESNDDYVRKFIFVEDNGEVIDGKIVEVIASREFIKINGDKTLLKGEEAQVDGFDGLIIKYHINYEYLAGKYYKNGTQMPGYAFLSTNLPKPITGNKALSTSTKPVTVLNRLSEGFARTNVFLQNPVAPAKKIAAFEPVMNDGESCEIIYKVYIEKDEAGNIVNWVNLGPIGIRCVQADPQNPPGSTNVYVDCAGEVWGSAYDADCGCIGGNTGIQSCEEPILLNQVDITLLKPCAKTIFRKLDSFNSSMANIFSVFGTISPAYGFNWTLKDGTLPQYVNGRTKDDYTSMVTTTIDFDKFNDATDLLIARTILHEAAHAYFLRLFYANRTMADVEFETLIDLWTNSNLAYASHETMVNDFVAKIAQSLQAYGDFKGYGFLNNLEKAQFYQDMAWGGLEDTDAFKGLSQSIRNRISNRLRVEQFNVNTSGFTMTQIGNRTGC